MFKYSHDEILDQRRDFNDFYNWIRKSTRIYIINEIRHIHLEASLIE